jgi:hypothetical protein
MPRDLFAGRLCFSTRPPRWGGPNQGRSAMFGLPTAETVVATVQQEKDGFLALLPDIVRIIKYCFRFQGSNRREELIADAVALSFVGYRRLIASGKEDRVFATALAKFAVRQVVDGRRVGARMNVNDALSPIAKRQQRIKRVGFQDDRCASVDFGEVVIADKRTSPADVACFKVDLEVWLNSLRPKMRAIALTLAVGHTPLEVARYLNVSKARVSQFRQELRLSWEAFQGPLAM